MRKAVWKSTVQKETDEVCHVRKSVHGRADNLKGLRTPCFRLSQIRAINATAWMQARKLEVVKCMMIGEHARYSATSRSHDGGSGRENDDQSSDAARTP